MTKYLRERAAPEAAAAAAIPGRHDRALVIPAKAEEPEFWDRIAPALAGAGRVLAVVVVNAPRDAPAAVHAQNAALLESLSARVRRRRAAAAGVVCGEADGATLVVVDRASPGRRLPRRQGVGLARGLGCDLALALRADGRLGSRWIHTTDADAALPAGYFAAADAAPPGAAALCYPFWHEVSPGASGRALALYELSLRYYVLGLASAGSPYAFHTLGSALAADADAYAAVRGVPKREAAEDFYLLGKLAKVGPVARARAAPIRLRERLSDRVPVGTGPATRAIADDLAGGGQFRIYAPRAFALLGHLLAAADAFAHTRDLDDLDRPARALAAEGRPDEAGAYRAAVRTLGVGEALSRAASGVRGAAGLARRWRGWFDALRTLRFIHEVQRAGLGPIPWRDALAGADFLPHEGELATGSLAAARRGLAAREDDIAGEARAPA